jgi:multidrug efflux pump subunit AcrB
VQADVRPKSKVPEVTKDLVATTLPTLMNRYPGLTYSFEGRQAENRKSIESLRTAVPLVLITIFALLAVPFRSYAQPLIVMVSIPFGLVGATIGHLIMGYNFSLIGMIGIVALSGVVVNDALILIDFANRMRQEHATAREAIVAAGVQRFRPIMLTTLTTFGGLMPMIFETSRQARFLVPMAISLGYGLLFATLITLLLIPSLYLIVEDARLALSRRHTRKTDSA